MMSLIWLLLAFISSALGAAFNCTNTVRQICDYENNDAYLKTFMFGDAINGSITDAQTFTPQILMAATTYCGSVNNLAGCYERAINDQCPKETSLMNQLRSEVFNDLVTKFGDPRDQLATASPICQQMADTFYANSTDQAVTNSVTAATVVRSTCADACLSKFTVDGERQMIALCHQFPDAESCLNDCTDPSDRFALVRCKMPKLCLNTNNTSGANGEAMTVKDNCDNLEYTIYCNLPTLINSPDGRTVAKFTLTSIQNLPRFELEATAECKSLLNATLADLAVDSTTVPAVSLRSSTTSPALSTAVNPANAGATPPNVTGTGNVRHLSPMSILLVCSSILFARTI